jgi:hypothetical protein
MVKKVTKTEKKEGLKHHQKIIMKATAKIDFKNKEIKSLRIEHLNLYEKLKGMEKVMH